MCDVLDRIENRGIQTGIQKGIQKGKAQIMWNMYQKGFSLEQISDIVEETVDEVRNVVTKEKSLLS